MALFVIALLVAGAEGVAAGPLTIEDFVSQVRDANPSLRASRLRAKAQLERVDPAGAWDDPFFAVGPDEIPFGGGEGSVTRFQLSQTVPFPGKSGARKRAAGLRARGSEEEASVTERALSVAAHQAFHRLYLNRKSLELNSQTRGLIQSAMESARARYRTGDATHHDWLLAKVELSVLAVERLRLEREGRTLLAVLNELRDRPVEEEVTLAEPDFARLESQVAAELAESGKRLDGQPELQSLDRLVGALEADEKLARLGYAPDFVVQGMVMKSGHAAEPSNWGLMVGINLPISFASKQSNLVSAAVLEREAALAEQRALENRLNAELSDARQQLKTAKDVVLLYRGEVIPSTEVAASNARSGYAARKLPLSQLLETLRVRRAQSLELAAARIDLALSFVRIRELLSNPPILRLAPGRPTLFGATSMGAMGGSAMSGMGGMSEGASGSVRMGGGMSGTTRKQAGPGGRSERDEGMSGMGGM